jgi:hypothetical protein
VETVGTAQTGPVGMAGPLKVRDVVAFDRHVALMCPAPSDRRTQRRPQRPSPIFSNVQITAKIEISPGKIDKGLENLWRKNV